LWIRIETSFFILMRIQIQGAKSMRIHVDPDCGFMRIRIMVRLESHKKFNFYMKNIGNNFK
jgi:hypothetical protein